MTPQKICIPMNDSGRYPGESTTKRRAQSLKQGESLSSDQPYFYYASRCRGEHLAQLKVGVVSISPDAQPSQKRFAEKNALDFPFLSDVDHKVAKNYGVWRQKTMYGKKFEGINRSSFLIDEKGQMITAWYKISPQATVPEALKVLES